MEKFTMKIICNKCGSEDIEVETEEIWIEHEFAYIKTTYKCQQCGNIESDD